jgi:hypothetical protein
MQLAAGVVLLLGILGLGNDNVNFDAVKPGVTPPNWSFAATRDGQHPRWEVRYDPSAPSRGNVLQQIAGTPRENEFPVAVFDKVVCLDGDLSVKFKIAAGSRNRTAGIVWRYQDPDNYYLLRFSADQKNIAIYRIQNGESRAVPIEGGKAGVAGVAHDLQAGQWYVAKVMFRGPRIRVLFGNRRLFDAVDAVVGPPGKTGVWTRGRTSAAFDDFRVDKRS